MESGNEQPALINNGLSQHCPRVWLHAGCSIWSSLNAMIIWLNVFILNKDSSCLLLVVWTCMYGKPSSDISTCQRISRLYGQIIWGSPFIYLISFTSNVGPVWCKLRISIKIRDKSIWHMASLSLLSSRGPVGAGMSNPRPCVGTKEAARGGGAPLARSALKLLVVWGCPD